MGGYTKYKRRVLNQKVIHHKFQGIHNLNSHSALVFIMLCPHMVPSDILDSAATSKRHGQLQLLLQHAHYFFHPMLSLRSKPVNYWASNLQNHYRKHQGRAHSGKKYLKRKKKKRNRERLRSEHGYAVNHHYHTKTARAPRATALNTSVPRLTPPSKRTGIFPSTA